MPGLPKPRSPCAHRPLYSRYIRSHQLTALVQGVHCRIRGSGGGAGWATRRDTKLASGVSGAAVLRTLPLGGELLRKIVLGIGRRLLLVAVGDVRLHVREQAPELLRRLRSVGRTASK